ncbi:nitrate- and nitrite sensing domain-containing protein [Actinophytocola sp. NPDC049390]|uniref:sensor histidine kinase n=1 Tax=Actinophytocola sp. NPDC049390 TaxID=3363894 RepID=UPI0037AD9E16
MNPPHEKPAGATWWSAAVQWRNWPLLVKLGVVLVVPVVGALVLGVLRVRADVELAESYASIERVAEVRVQLVRVLSALQHERNEAVGDGTRFTEATAATDAAIKDVTEVIGDTSGDQQRVGASSDYRDLVGALSSLIAARGQRAADGAGLVVLNGYNAVTKAVLEFDRSLVGRFPDEDLTDTSIALGELQSVREQVSLQQAIGSLALRDDQLSGTARQMMVEAGVRLDDQLGDFRSVAPPKLRERYDTTVTGQDVTARQQMVDAARTMGPAQARFTAAEWNAVSDTTIGQLSEVTQLAAGDLRSAADDLAESVSDRAGLESVLLLAMVLLAAGVGGGLGRYLVRSFTVLRRSALAVANERLPAAVTSIRAGDAVAVEPVPLHTTEEFGQLARAFDAVQDQAVRSAAEEAALRSNLANIFTNLSRRSQGLVERQLRLMEQLEQKTDDPDQLANLFRIDHLATRMRRNNENLMVLSGTGMLRRFTEPMPLPDVLRAAISEVEHYERAIVRSAPDVRVVGYAAGDLIRSVSELVENATAFSPPDSVVGIESRLRGDGSVMVDVLDDGVGMGETELREANHRVAGGGGVDVPISRQMGLFVVGRLTARHDVRVRLSPRPEGGLCASVLVPAALVGPAEPALVSASAPATVAPDDVAGRLESAGISVRLPELPRATTPASILFAASTPTTISGTGFGWLNTPPGGTPQIVAAPETAAAEAGPDGLPKRVPKGQLLAPPVRPQPSTGAKRDAARARGFLSGFQSGVRRGETES